MWSIPPATQYIEAQINLLSRMSGIMASSFLIALALVSVYLSEPSLVVWLSLAV